MIRTYRTAVLLLALYTLFAQPGLPACWMMQRPCDLHDHPYQYTNPLHRYNYLFDDVSSGEAPLLPSLWPQTAELLHIIGLSDLTRSVARPYPAGGSWLPDLPTPPPRHVASH
ncbi:MAG: hypothetical protein VB089_05000 [Anaerolineaceae bacterium]|nr:hypothetical protein [Anaerolineaceae bacterium]